MGWSRHFSKVLALHLSGQINIDRIDQLSVASDATPCGNDCISTPKLDLSNAMTKNAVRHFGVKKLRLVCYDGQKELEHCWSQRVGRISL